MLRLVVLSAFLGGIGLSSHPVSAAHRVGFVFQGHSSHLNASQQQRLRRYRRNGCRIFSLSARQQSLALRSLSHAFYALNDKRMHQVIFQKRFTYTLLRGREILERIRLRSQTLPIFGYHASMSCPVGLKATAFAVRKMIFLNASYLQRIHRTNNWRRLAQTLAHEWMHGVGFGHGSNGGQSSVRKRNSVPIFVGCLVKFFPDLKRGQRVCAGRSRWLHPYWPSAPQFRRKGRSQRPSSDLFDLDQHPKDGFSDWLDGVPSRRSAVPAPRRVPSTPLKRNPPSRDWLDEP